MGLYCYICLSFIPTYLFNVCLLSLYFNMFNMSGNRKSVVCAYICLSTNNNGTHYREEVEQLAMCCRYNNCSINVEKMKEMVVDF